MAETDKGKLLANRYTALEKIREDFMPLWKDIVEFVNIRRYNLDGTKSKGSKVGLSIYDSTAALALKDLSDGLFGYLISPGMEWFKLRLAPEFMMNIPSVAMWLEEVEWVIYFDLQRSNFYEVMPEYFIDGGSIGTATLYCEEELPNQRPVFLVCNPGEVVIAEDRFGKVDTIYRKFKTTARQAAQRWSEKKFSQGLQQNVKTNPDKEHEFIHAVFPNTDIEMFLNEQGLWEPKIGVSNFPWQSYYVEVSESRIVSEAGYRQMPFSTWRWRKNSDEWYGRSPAADCLVDILMKNQMGRSLINAAHIATEPAYNIPEELRGKVKLGPRGRNYYDDPQRIITPVNTGLQYPIGTDREDRIARTIERHFMVDFFTLLSRAAMEGQQLNVPQVMEMLGEKAVMLGTVIGRLTSECFNPVIDRVFGLAEAAGRIPRPPDILVEMMGGAPIHVEYMGPLAQAQKKVFKTHGIYQAIESVVKLGEIRPEIMDIPDWDYIGRELLTSTGLSAKAIRDPRVVEKMRAIRQAQQAEAAQAQADLQRAQVTPSLSKKIEEGSPLDVMGKTEVA